MEARAERLAAEEAELLEGVEIARAASEAARDQLAATEDAAAEAERAHMAEVRAVADRREGLARLSVRSTLCVPASNPSTRKCLG